MKSDLKELTDQLIKQCDPTPDSMKKLNFTPHHSNLPIISSPF